MHKDKRFDALENYVKDKFQNEGTGHDWYHIERVIKLSVFIAEKEGASADLVYLTALLHDINDHKFNGGDFEANRKSAQKLLEQHNFEKEIISLVTKAIDEISFKGNQVKDSNTTEISKIVQDADRLDAIGAIGIARTFAYGGSIDQPIYDPEIPPAKHDTKEAYFNARTHTINHFYEKLLLLKDRMHTKTAKKIAEKRHQIMDSFLKDFYSEWKFLE